MKSRYRVGALVVAAGAILLAPVVSRAEHLHLIPRPVRSAQTAQAVPDASGSALYNFTTIDYPGNSQTFSFGMDNPGLVSGYYFVDIPSVAQGFLLQNGHFITVDFPGAEHTLLGQVSNSGLAVGNYGSFFTQHAALYQIATATWITLPDVPNEPINIGNGVTPQGIAVGSASSGNLNVIVDSIGWIWDGKYSFFTVPQAPLGLGLLGTEPIGINSRGDVSGYFQDVNGVYHGFLKHGSTFTQIDVPGANQTPGNGTFANGINNRGDIVGYYLDQQLNYHGFLLSGGQFTTIDVPVLGSETFLTNINEPGDLVGYWLDPTGRYRGFTASRR